MLCEEFKDKIYSYINKRYEDDWVLVSADEVYETFQYEFDCFYPVELIDEVMDFFLIGCDLTDIKIEWEGNLHGCQPGSIERGTA